MFEEHARPNGAKHATGPPSRRGRAAWPRAARRASRTVRQPHGAHRRAALTGHPGKAAHLLGEEVGEAAKGPRGTREHVEPKGRGRGDGRRVQRHAAHAVAGPRAGLVEGHVRVAPQGRARRGRRAPCRGRLRSARPRRRGLPRRRRVPRDGRSGCRRARGPGPRGSCAGRRRRGRGTRRGRAPSYRRWAVSRRLRGRAGRRTGLAGVWPVGSSTRSRGRARMRLATSPAAVSPTWPGSSRTSSEAGAIAGVLLVALPPAVSAPAELAANRGNPGLEARDGLADEMRRRVVLGPLAQGTDSDVEPPRLLCSSPRRITITVGGSSQQEERMAPPSCPRRCE